MTANEAAVRHIPHQPQRPTSAGASAVEWYRPTSPDRSWDGSSTFTAQPQHDSVTGEMFIRVQVGQTFAYFKPDTLLEAARQMARDAFWWSECHVDNELDACVSGTCLMKQGRFHLGRLSSWERTRTRRVVGGERDPEIIRLHKFGLSGQKIAWRVGWSESTVNRVIREHLESA